MAESTIIETAGTAHACRLCSEGSGPIRVVRVAGHLDWATSEHFSHLLHDECREPGIVIDLTAAASQVDSAGTSILLAAAVLCGKRGQHLVVVTDDHALLAVLGSTGLPTVVPIVSTEDAAIDYLRALGITGTAA